MTTHAKTDTTLHRRRLLAATVLAVGLGLAPHALAQSRSGLVDLTVVDRETGSVLPFWSQGGRPFVAGDPGRRYGLRVSNRTGGRVLLVMSVDGVNILTGETGGYDQRGYVLDAYQSYDVNGWRKSDAEVAAFTFAPLPLSYAARTGRPGDVGVIGMAVFRERAPPPPPPQPREEEAQSPWRGRRASRPPMDTPPPLPIPPVPAPVRQGRSPPVAAPSAADGRAMAESAIARRPEERLGTAHGAREWSSVTSVSFERATASPQALRRIEYDTAAHLLARGVTPPPSYPVGRPPRPFPQEPAPGGFVPDPPRYR